jgi:hypothetical protein
MSDQHTILIDPVSTQSLFIELFFGNTFLSSATGFVVAHNGVHHLITNWHVVTGRDAETEKPLSPTAAIPDTARIVYHMKDKLGAWVYGIEPLYSNEVARWREHPRGREIDVIALPLSGIPKNSMVFPTDLALANADMRIHPAMPVSIIGFPLGLSAGGAWPIWKTGHIATDPDVDYDNRPSFLIDATTRGGMSGSPVVARVSGALQTQSGNYVIKTGITTKFLGVYSGRIHGDAELGRVWRPLVIDEILGIHAG